MNANYETVTWALREDVKLPAHAGRKAAAELLLWHDTWPRRGDFHRLATITDAEGDVRIAWSHAREAFEADKFGPSSSSEFAVLEIALALATDRYRFNLLGHAHAAAVLRAMTAALPQATATIEQKLTASATWDKRDTYLADADRHLSVVRSALNSDETGMAGSLNSAIISLRELASATAAEAQRRWEQRQ